MINKAVGEINEDGGFREFSGMMACGHEHIRNRTYRGQRAP